MRPLAAELVAEGPDDDGGVVAVTLDHGPHVGDVRRRVAEEPVLVHDHDAQPVVDVEHRRVGRVVRGAPPVASDGAGGLGAEEADALGHGHAHDREAVVVAEAAHLG